MVFIARITLNGLDDIARVLEGFRDAGKDIADRMLYAGGYVAKSQLKEEVQRHHHIDTGSMYENIGYTDPKGKGSERFVTAYPRGSVKRKNKTTSNALKGFVLNYGSAARGITGDMWFDKGVYASEQQIEKEMIRVFDEQIEKIVKL